MFTVERETLKQVSQRELSRCSVDLYTSEYEDILHFFSVLRQWQTPEKLDISNKQTVDLHYIGLVRDLNPGPLAPEARIIPLDQRARG